MKSPIQLNLPARCRYCKPLLSWCIGLLFILWSFTAQSADINIALSVSEGYGLHVECPNDVIISCGDSYDETLPLPEVSTDCHNCREYHIDGFIYMGTLNGHKYYCSKDKMTWQQAKWYCESKGGYLAAINDAEENAFLADLIQADAAYIGLSDHEQEGEFKWMNGDPMEYENWYVNQPNNYYGKQDYVELLKNGYWNDQYYNKSLEFIMEIPCYTITKVHDSYSYRNSYKYRDIGYKVKDACGNVELCYYTVKYHDEVKFWCPSDIEVTTEHYAAKVWWNKPTYETCCNDCIGSHYDIDGYIYMGSWQGSHYYCSKDQLTWREAQLKCKKDGGYLAMIESAEENEYVSSRILTNYAYIGVSDHEKEGEWKTVDNKLCTFYNWYPGEPDNTNGQQHYVEINKYGYWNDQYDYKKREYVLEIPHCTNVYQTAGLPPGSEFPVGTTKVSYKLKDGCGNTEYCSFYVTVGHINNEANYCDIQGNNTYKGYIDQVSLNNKWFKSGNNLGYKYHDSYCVNVHPDGRLYIKLRPGSYSYYHKAYWMIYLDINQDGDFDDPGEYLGKGNSYGSLYGTLDIPENAEDGKTRLRVVMKIGSYSDSTCGEYEYGETEDFCIYIRGYKNLNQEPGSELAQTKFEPVELFGDDDLHILTNNPVLDIYPNPAINTITVRSSIEYMHDSYLEILNTAGQIIRKEPLDGNKEKKLNISDMSSGIYLVKYTDKEGNIHLKKFVVK